jgi:ubiquitin-protein ligase
MTESNIVFVHQNSIKRLISDIKQINKHPLTSQGIYYHHSEEDMMKGYAMIVGPQETPYENGYYFFEFNFPSNYPFSPPTVTSCTQDGITRFNPNMYINGKVCVSILNTWTGEQWSSCQTLSSILLVLCTILCKDPYTNEPQMTINHPDCNNYTKIIEYKNIEVSILKMMTKELLPKRFNIFYPIMKELFFKNKEQIIKKISDNLSEINIIYSVSNYNMKVKVNYNDLFQKIIDISELIK